MRIIEKGFSSSTKVNRRYVSVGIASRFSALLIIISCIAASLTGCATYKKQGIYQPQFVETRVAPRRANITVTVDDIYCEEVVTKRNKKKCQYIKDNIKKSIIADLTNRLFIHDPNSKDLQVQIQVKELYYEIRANVWPVHSVIPGVSLLGIPWRAFRGKACIEMKVFKNQRMIAAYDEEAKTETKCIGLYYGYRHASGVKSLINNALAKCMKKLKRKAQEDQALSATL